MSIKAQILKRSAAKYNVFWFYLKSYNHENSNSKDVKYFVIIFYKICFKMKT